MGLESLGLSQHLIWFLQGFAATVTIFTGGYGIYKWWSYAERRLFLRLTEYIEREEHRLAEARILLLNSLKRLEPHTPTIGPLFASGQMCYALRQMSWGWGDEAESNLLEVVAKADRQKLLALRKAEFHDKEKATAHVLIGALADARGQHGVALDHFNQAMAIDSGDAEAFEYVAHQKLRLGEPQAALEQFEQLEKIGKKQKDRGIVSRSRLGQGQAYLALPIPQPLNAMSCFEGAIEQFPENGDRVDLALLYEMEACVRHRRPLAHVIEARARYKTAESIYSTVRTREGVYGQSRIREKLKEFETQNSSGRSTG